jgi:hypothetical protein
MMETTGGRQYDRRYLSNCDWNDLFAGKIGRRLTEKMTIVIKVTNNSFLLEDT